MNKLNLRQYHVVVDGLYNNLVLNLDYISDQEKMGNRPLWTKGYVFNETNDLVQTFKNQLLKKFVNDQTVTMYDNLFIKLKEKYSINK